MPSPRHALIAMPLVMVASVLAGCDNTPDAKFEQSQKEQQAANAPDPYASLETATPRQLRYVHQEPAARPTYAESQAVSFGATYDGLLGRPASDKRVDAKAPLYLLCRAAFGQASGGQDKSGGDAKVTVAARKRALAALAACREKTLAAASEGMRLPRLPPSPPPPRTGSC